MKVLKIITLGLIINIILLFYSCFSKSESSENLVAVIDSVFNRLQEDEMFNGEILISKEDNIIFQKHFGKADLIKQSNFSHNSIFEIASLSKPFTALAIAILVDNNVLSYEDEIIEYLSYFPYKGITIKQVIIHTSGLPDYPEFFYNNWNFNEVANNKDIINTFITSEVGLISKSGEKFHYSNLGYNILAEIVEIVSGVGFPDYCHQNIFKPLGMTNTYMPNNEEAKKDRNYVHDYWVAYGSKSYIQPDIYPELDNISFTANAYGASGVCSNATDLYRFSKIFSSNKLLSDSIMKLYSMPIEIDFKIDRGNGMSLGWSFINDSILGHSVFFPGGVAGYRSIFQYFPQDGILIVILNNTAAQTHGLREILVDCWLGNKINYPRRSYIEALSRTLRKSDEQNILQYDSSKYVLNEYEIDYMMEELIEEKDFKKAFTAIDNLREYLPNYYKLYFYRGEMQRLSGMKEESIIEYKKALELNPKDSTLMRLIDSY